MINLIDAPQHVPEPLELPPSDPDAEQCVLGCMLRDNSLIPAAAEMLHADDFYQNSYRDLFRVILEVWATGVQVRLEGIYQHVKSTRKPGPDQFLCFKDIEDIWDICPTAGGLPYYARKVKSESIKRRIRNTCWEMLGKIDRTEDGFALLEYAEKEICAIADVKTVGKLTSLDTAIDEAVKMIDQRSDGTERSGILTGLIDPDRILCGFRPGELIILAARTSVGKTALGITIARYAATVQKERVFFASLEQNYIELATRIICAQGNIDSHALRKGRITLQQADAITSVQESIRGAALFFDDGPGQSIIRIASNARRLKIGGGLGLIVVDYLGLVEASGGTGRESRQEQVATVSRRLKGLAKEMNCPVVALSQLNREVEHRSGEKPRLADLRDSGAIEQDADTVIMLSRVDDEKDSPTTLVRFDVAKQRNGPREECIIVYRKAFMRFENYAPIRPEYKGVPD